MNEVLNNTKIREEKTIRGRELVRESLIEFSITLNNIIIIDIITFSHMA